MQKRFFFAPCPLLTRVGVALLMLTPAVNRANAQNLSVSVSTNTQNTMKHFVIIFRQSPRKLSDTDLTQRQKEVSVWAREQNAAGHKLEPRILAPDVLRPGNEREDGIGKDAWPITAFLFLEASDLSAAARVAESHPANHFGASVEVRPWSPPAVPSTPVR